MTQFWEKQQQLMDASLQAGGPLAGGYRESGALPITLGILLEDYCAKPTYMGWLALHDSFILPNMSFLHAWQTAERCPSLAVIKQEKLYPDPAVLKKGISVLVSMKRIEIEANLQGMQAQSDFSFMTI